jgi:acetylornithine deacetylase
MSDQIKAIIEKHGHQTEQFLIELLRFPSTPGQEIDAMEFLSGKLAPLFTSVEKIGLSNSIKDDQDYSSPIPDIDYEGRYNLCAGLRGDKGKRILLNTHIDVVPASAGQNNAFNPSIKDGIIYARGACDAKGQAAVIYLVAKALNELGPESRNELVAHLVVEEENGGNGTLAMARRGEKADAAIVLEPTAGKIFTSVRGAVWFRVTLTGKSGHSGKAGQTKSALKLAIEAVEILEDYHKRLLVESKGIDLFDKYENPMPITFGKLHAGTWPATAPGEAVIEGVLGLLPNKTRHEVMVEMEQALVENGSEWLKDNIKLEFMYRHDCHVLDVEHPLPKTLIQSCKAAGTAAEIDAMTASCDSWLYNNQLGIPTVVFGAGDLQFAHSNNEQISMDEIKSTATALVHLICDY